jgi:predicted small secreted protein
MKAIRLLLIAGLLLLTLTACATIRGMGEDLQNLGRGIRETVR